MKRREERTIEAALYFSAILSIIIFGLIFIFLLKEAIPKFSNFSLYEFILGREWFPASFKNPRYGALPLITGSFLVVVTATLIAVPVGVARASYISESITYAATGKRITLR